MNDPHVVSLQYRLDEAGGQVLYRNPPPISWNTPDFDAELVDGRLTCTLKRHFATVSDAKTLVDGQLRVWEIEAALRREYREFHFVYEKPDIVDRNPDPAGPSEASARVSQFAIETAISVTTRDTYPNPPAGFHLDPNVTTLWNRYEGYLAKREPLQAMAYFCLTMVEYELPSSEKRRHTSKKRTAASKKYNIELAILDKLGELTSAKGDVATARKFEAMLQMLSEKEELWIRAAVKALILRIGEYDPENPFLTPLTMQDLPAL